MTSEQILKQLQALASPAQVEGMVRFGISSTNTLGLSMKTLHTMAKAIGKDHQIAGELWASGIHEARILAALVDDPVKVTGRQMDAWVKEIDSWDVCDQCCMNLFVNTPAAYQKALHWSTRRHEFVKRAGFALMAVLAVHDKKAPDSHFLPFLLRIQAEAADERNFVKKAVNWALRQIGKRNSALRHRAIEAAEELIKSSSPAARWVASDALRELNNAKTLKRISSK